MGIVIVGQKGGKRVVRWPQALGLAVCSAMVFGLGIGCGFRLLTGFWVAPPFVVGGMGGLILMGIGLISGLRTQLERLTPIS